jgi:hypothetical protein
MSRSTVGRWGPPESGQSQPLSWASESRVYDWRPSYTLDTAPDDPGLEQELFHEDKLINSGINFKNYSTMSVSIKGGPPNHKPLESVSGAKTNPKNPTQIWFFEGGS